MQVNIASATKHAIVITEKDLFTLSEVIALEYGELTITAECSDKAEFRTSDIGELLNFDNPSYRMIKNITINAGGTSDGYCKLELGELGIIRAVPARITIKDTDEKRALKVSTDLEKLLLECRPYYSFLAFLVPTPVFLFLVFLLGLGMWWYNWIAGVKIAPGRGISMEDIVFMIVPVAGSLFFLSRYVDRGWQWLVPVIWFSIGRQKQEFDKRVQARRVVFVSIFLAIAIKVVLSFASPMLAK